MEVLGAPQAPPPAIVSAVLDDDDLLCEILLRLAFPTSLVRAALVCKRWLRLASAPAFLRHFRRLHPPRFLGFYVTGTKESDTSRFVPLPQPPELAAVVRRGTFDLDSWGCWGVEVKDCINGLLLLAYECSLNVNKTPIRILHCPLHPARNPAVLPPVPDTTTINDGSTITYDVVESEILYNVIGHQLSYFYFAMMSNEQHTVVDVYMLQQDDTWAICSSTVRSDVPEIDQLTSTFIADDHKIYSVARVGGETNKLFLLDLTSSALSLVDLPEEVNTCGVLLSLPEEDSNFVHLTHVKDFRIRIWRHRMDRSTGVTDWFLVNTICLRDICANNMIPSRVFQEEEEYILLCAVGGEFEFVLLEKDGVIYMVDLERKSANKVYEAPEGEDVYSVSTFMMVWPPKFPAIMKGCDP